MERIGIFASNDYGITMFDII
jgi:hypothetical protein